MDISQFLAIFSSLRAQIRLKLHRKIVLVVLVVIVVAGVAVVAAAVVVLLFSL